MDNESASREIQVYKLQPSGVTTFDARSASVRTRRRRGFMIWVRRWLRTSKPTEWITSTAQMMAVVAAITTGVIYLTSGVLDSRKAAIDANIALLKIDERYLEGRIAKLKNDEMRIKENRALLDLEAATSRMHLESSRLASTIANEEADSYLTDLIQWAKELASLNIFQKTGNETGLRRSIISKIAKFKNCGDLPKIGMQNLPYTIRRRSRRI